MKQYHIIAGTFMVIVLLCIISIPAEENKENRFDILNLIGRWEGAGSFLVPMTNTEISIEGNGQFVYDSLHHRIRTSLYGSKFMLTYSDSGYLQYYPNTDSVSWEVWDSWGKHAVYWGVIKDNELQATRVSRHREYQVSVKFPHPDTLDFRLYQLMKDSTQVNRATFLLWRVE